MYQPTWKAPIRSAMVAAPVESVCWPSTSQPRFTRAWAVRLSRPVSFQLPV